VEIFLAMSYLNTILLSKTVPDLAEPGRIIVIANPDASLDEVIPCLATLPIMFGLVKVAFFFQKRLFGARV